MTIQYGNLQPIDQTPEIITLRSGNAHLETRLYPRSSSETVILLHGGPGVPDEMTEVREFLTGYLQVITFDQRGTGTVKCRECTFSIADYISDINCIASYAGLDRFHLFGHSWGGLYAQLYAMKHPERIISLFLCSPVSGTGRVWNQSEKEVFRYNLSRSTPGEMIRMALNAMLGLLGSDKAYRRLFRQIILNYHKGYNVPPPEPEKLVKINSRAANKTRRAIKRYSPLPVFGTTPYPVMITYGEFDAYGESKKQVYERFSGAASAIIPNCGHTPWKHNPGEFKKVLKDFYGGMT